MACLPTSLQCLWSGHSHSGFHGSYFSFPLFHLQTSPLNLGLIPQLCRPLLVLSSIVLIRGLPYPVIFFISKVVFFLLEVPYYKIHLCTLDHFSLYTHFWNCVLLFLQILLHISLPVLFPVVLTSAMLGSWVCGLLCLLGSQEWLTGAEGPAECEVRTLMREGLQNRERRGVGGQAARQALQATAASGALQGPPPSTAELGPRNREADPGGAATWSPLTTLHSRTARPPERIAPWRLGPPFSISVVVTE